MTGLFIERMAEDTPARRVRGEVRRFKGGEGIVESADDKRLAGKPALHRLARRKTGGWILVRAQLGDPAKGHWALTALCEGEKADADLARMRKALDSFTTDLSKPRPEGMFEDRLFGYRISFDGFEGPKHDLAFVMLEMCSLALGGGGSGSFGVRVGNYAGDHDADWARLRRHQEGTGARLVTTEETKHGSRPVRDVLWETGKGDGKGTLRQRIIWDDGVRWMVLAVHPGVDAKGPAKPLHTALESFRVIDEKPADDAKEPGKDD